MTKFKDIIITSAGQNALNLAVTAGHKITYTKASLASDDLASKSISDMQAITTLNSVKNSDLARLGSFNGSTVLSATFDNSSLTNDMKFNSVGWYAKTGDAEFLFAVSRYDQEQVLGALEPGKENITQSITLQIALAVSQGAVNVTQTQAGVAMKSDLNTAVDNLSNSINQLSNAKADKDTVTADLAKKADQASVDASVKSINDALATKADKATVESELSTKANQSDLDKTNAEVAKKASTTDVNSQLATKADAKDVTDALAKKDDTTDVDAKIKTVIDLANTKADASDTYNKKAVDDAFSQRDSKITNAQNTATQASQKADDNFNKRPVINGAAGDDLFAYKSNQLRLYPGNGQNCKNLPPASNTQWFTVEYIFENPNGDGIAIFRSPASEVWLNGNNGGSYGNWLRLANAGDITNLQNAINTKANSSDVYSKSDVDGKTSGTFVTGYDLATKNTSASEANVNSRWIVDPAALAPFADAINQLKGRQNVDAPDFNNLTDTGVYYVSDSKHKGMTNGPTNNWGVLVVSNGSNHRISQVYYPDDGNPPWYRSLNESTWRPWYQLSTRNDVGNANNAANAASSKVDNVLGNSYFRKQGMNAYGDLVEIRGNAAKQTNGGYAFDIWSSDWTASQLKDVMNELPNKANSADVNNQLAGKANTGDVSALQGKVNVDTDLFRMISSANNWGDIFGKTGKFNALTSLRINPNNSGLVNNSYSAGIGFGGDDTKGVLSVDYSNHDAVIAGGNDSGNWSEHVAWQSNITNLQNQINSKANASDLASKANASDLAGYAKTTDLAGYAKSTDVASKAQITDLQNQISELKDSSFEVQTFKDEASGKAWEAQKAGHRLAIIQS